MRAVVLGDGILGLHAMRALADGGHWLRPVGRINLDLKDPVPSEAFLGADLVVNTAAVSDIDQCESDPDLARRVNATGAGEVAKAAAAAGARLVHLSTDHALHPSTVYGRTRAEGERLVLEAKPDALVVRCSTAFGPHPSRRDFVKWLLDELRANGQVVVPDDMTSSPTYAPEAARFVAEAAERGLAGGTYQVVNHRGISRFEFANLVQRAFGAPGSVVRGKLADYKGFKTPRPADTCMAPQVPDWFQARPLEACLADYAERERAEGQTKEGHRE